jgi:predicted amidohydrolase
MPITYNKQQNLSAILSIVEDSESKNVDLLILPETCLQGYCWDAESFYDYEQRKYYLETAESIPGPSTEIIAEIGRAHV